MEILERFLKKFTPHHPDIFTESLQFVHFQNQDYVLSNKLFQA